VKMVNALLVQITVMLVNHLKNALHVRKEPLKMMENVINVKLIVTIVKIKILVIYVILTFIIMKILV